MTAAHYVPSTIKYVKTSDLRANPHNPRMLFDREPLDTLKASIDKVGILVPLTVYVEKRTGHTVILDGQRRWMCAQELHLKQLPVNIVAEPSLVENIVTMFQIHQVRADWELMPTALKLKLLMEELKEKRDSALAELTGLNKAVVVRCKKLISFPAKYQDMMLEPNRELRIKADFFIELDAVLTDRDVKAMGWFKRDVFIDRMLARYAAKRLASVTDFRRIKQHIGTAIRGGRRNFITAALKEYVEDVTLDIDHLASPDASLVSQVKSVRRATDVLRRLLADLNAKDVIGEEGLWADLESLEKLIRARLALADRRSKA